MKVKAKLFSGKENILFQSFLLLLLLFVNQMNQLSNIFVDSEHFAYSTGEKNYYVILIIELFSFISTHLPLYHQHYFSSSSLQ